MVDLSSVQSLSLEDLVGSAADALPYAIYQAQVAVNGLRSALADEDKWLADAKNACLSDLYARPEGAGKNEKERNINEQKALSANKSVYHLQNNRDGVARRLADAEAGLSWAQDRFRAVQAKARVVGALLEYAAAMRLPLNVTAAAPWDTGTSTQKPEMTSQDQIPF